MLKRNHTIPTNASNIILICTCWIFPTMEVRKVMEQKQNKQFPIGLQELKSFLVEFPRLSYTRNIKTLLKVNYFKPC